MHTIVIRDGSKGGDDIRVHHNSDWSGDAYVAWGEQRHAHIPGWIVKAMLEFKGEVWSVATDEEKAR